MQRLRALAAALILLAPALGVASDVGVTGHDGHPRDRLPLTVFVASFGNPALDAAAARAVDDWNRIASDALGVAVFAPVADAAAAQVVIATEPANAGRPMGVTRLEAAPDGVIVPPVRIVVQEPAARGQTSRETVLYQVLAHELGHALGLPHTTDPRSLMCCVHESLDFNDPAIRSAYVDARRKPDIGSVRTQLGTHYTRFWGK